MYNILTLLRCVSTPITVVLMFGINIKNKTVSSMNYTHGPHLYITNAIILCMHVLTISII